MALINIPGTQTFELLLDIMEFSSNTTRIDVNKMVSVREHIMLLSLAEVHD